MTAAIVITTLAYLHIISAVTWLGGATLFVSVIAPGLRSVSPMARLEFLAKVGPKASQFFIGAATATIVFGLALLSAFSVDFGWKLDTGITLALIAYLLALIVTVPSIRKASRLAREALASGQAGPPNPEIPKAMRRGGIASTIVVVLLVLTLAFMVATGFPF